MRKGSLIGSANEIIIHVVKKGSVILEVEMTEDDWHKLEAAFHEGRLAELGIINIADVPPNSTDYESQDEDSTHSFAEPASNRKNVFDYNFGCFSNAVIFMAMLFCAMGILVMLLTERYYANAKKDLESAILEHSPDGTNLDSAGKAKLEAARKEKVEFNFKQIEIIDKKIDIARYLFYAYNIGLVILCWIFVKMRKNHYRHKHKNCNI